MVLALMYAHHVVQALLHPAVERDAIAGNAQNDHDQNGHQHAQDGRERRVHHHGDGDAAQQHHRHAHAQGLQRLHAGLHVVAVAGHPAGEAWQTETVKGGAGQIGRLIEQGPADVIRNEVGVLDGVPVGHHI